MNSVAAGYEKTSCFKFRGYFNEGSRLMNFEITAAKLQSPIIGVAACKGSWTHTTILDLLLVVPFTRVSFLSALKESGISIS
jgi:hypothetical protein